MLSKVQDDALAAKLERERLDRLAMQREREEATHRDRQLLEGPADASDAACRRRLRAAQFYQAATRD